MKNKEDFLTVEELMELLGIGRNTAYKLLNSRDIKAFCIGRKWRIPQSSIDAYISEMLNTSRN